VIYSSTHADARLIRNADLLEEAARARVAASARQPRPAGRVRSGLRRAAATLATFIALV
jgi:hypothetical protein